ncbi:hypothetical protein [Bradyrhizobium sp. SZCCHNR2009]|uniref:hypothetical protein n=1 Tax=Bradyrhizobium sp. SZCCHNR2009 TaxID=3057375 RepID=UPI0028E21CD1|nr:hypothetical protein [Bradyrhizobium sp. SZCCHNR2009]
MADLAQIRAEIEHARKNVARMRRDLLALQKAERPTKMAEQDLEKLLDRVDTLIGERNRLRASETRPPMRRVLGGRKW